ncbi:MAG: serine/threonine protein kinase [Planctomycetota bacterium]
MTTDFNEPTIKLEGQVKPKIPDIEIEAKIGQGGMGMVFRGRQPYLDRLVAIKVLPQAMTQNTQFVERFQREAKILAGLNHPNIVGCYSAGQTDKGECYLTMEFIDGPNLRQWISKNGRLDERHALEIGRCLIQALSYANERDIIHRDVKPENVLLQQLTGKEATDAGFPFKVKLVDLGLARPSSKDSAETRDMALTVQGTIMGTPSTMAPEQFDDPDNVDHKADIYGLGCVLYHALAGEPAYTEQAITAIIKRKSTGEVPDPRTKIPELRPAVAKLVTDMLQPRRDDRPEYKQLLGRCEALLNSASGSGSVPDLQEFTPHPPMNPTAQTTTAGVQVHTGSLRVTIGAGGGGSGGVTDTAAPTVAAAPSAGRNTTITLVAIVGAVVVAIVGIVFGLTGSHASPATPTSPTAPTASVTNPPPEPAHGTSITPITPMPPSLPATPNTPNTTNTDTPPKPAPPAAPDFSQIPVAAAAPEPVMTFPPDGINLISPDDAMKGWKATPDFSWGSDEDFDGGLVGNNVSRIDHPWTRTPVRIEGDVVLYNNVGGNLSPRANEAGVGLVFADGRTLALDLAVTASTIATVERFDRGAPGVTGLQKAVKKDAERTDTYPGVLVLPKTEKVHFVLQIQAKTVYFEVNHQPLAEATRLPGALTGVVLFVNGTQGQTASFRSMLTFEPKQK